MNKFCGILILLIILGFQLYPSSGANAVLIDKYFDKKFRSQLSVPDFKWLKTDVVLLLDDRVDSEIQTIELLNPVTGKREPALNRVQVLLNFKSILGDDAPEVIEWPDAIEGMGNYLIYIYAGDLFLVELSNGKVKRLTNSKAVEEAVCFSPNGLWVSFIRENDIYVINLKSGKEIALTETGSETLLNGKLSWVYWEEIYDHPDVPYSWSPDSRSIAYLQSDETSVPVSTFVNFEPITPEKVNQRYPKAGQKNPVVRLGIVEVESAQTIWVDCGGYEYLARFNWLPNSTSIAVQTMNRKQSELKLFIANAKTGRAQKIIDERQKAWINLNDTPVFLSDSKRFIWMSERDGYQHLYLYRLEKNEAKLICQLTQGEYMVISSINPLTSGNGGLIGVDEKKGVVYFTSNRLNITEFQLFKIHLNGKNFKQMTTRAGVHEIYFSQNMQYYLDIFSNLSEPEELILCRANGKSKTVVTPSSKEELKTWRLSPVEFHYFKTNDGLKLPIIMQKPNGFNSKNSKKYPAIIYTYGGPGAQVVRNQWSLRKVLWNSVLNQSGYFTFVVEVRAGLPKDKKTETSVYKQAYGIQNVRDILTAVNWIKEIPSIDPNRIGIWGVSGGGSSTLYLMTHSKVFKAGISVAPVSDWYYYQSVYTERYMGLPQENPKGYKETSCVGSAKNLNGRLLLVHSTYDDNVHPQNSFAFINELIEHNIQFDLMIYPWRKHAIKDKVALTHLYTLMLNFWEKYL